MDMRLDVALNVLLVEDDPEAASVLEMILRRAGHTVRVAAGGNEAVILAALEAPELILMDMKLPDLSGFEAAKRIKTLLPDVKVIGISGAPIPSEAEGSILALDARLQKPITPVELLATVRRLSE
jgi:CheY-like chemotaxis protein